MNAAIPIAQNLSLALACHICEDFIFVGQLYHGENGSPKMHWPDCAPEPVDLARQGLDR